MSQKKMEAYKEAKKNKRQIEKKQKRNRILGWILGILIAAALIGGSAYLVYYTSVIRPAQQQAELEAELNAGEDDAGDLEGVDPGNIITIPADSLDGGDASDGGDAADDAGSTADESSETGASESEAASTE